MIETAGSGLMPQGEPHVLEDRRVGELVIPRSQHENSDTLVLRDHLAIDRTALANERTLLAYVRTGLAVAIVGGSLVKFFDSGVAELVGGAFLVTGPAMAWFGWSRFRRVRSRLIRVVRPDERRDSGTLARAPRS